MRTGLSVIGMSGVARVAKPLLGGEGACLMFHHCRDEPHQDGADASIFGANDHLSVTTGFLERLLEEFRREDVDLVTLDEALLRMKSEPSGRPFLAVTFD
ncbi:MAG: polysaccharide deacetylase, partial [Pseudomonadota bacterium]